MSLANCDAFANAAGVISALLVRANKALNDSTNETTQKIWKPLLYSCNILLSNGTENQTQHDRNHPSKEMSNSREKSLRQQLAGVAALLNDEQRAMRLMLHIGGDTATRTTTTTTTDAFDRLCSWLLTKLNNNDNDDDDNNGAANALRGALLATGINRATVDGVVNNVNWQVCVVRLLFFSFFFSCSTPTRCVLNRRFETISSQTAAATYCRHANASMTAARRLLETLVRGWNKIFLSQNKLF